MFTLALFFAGTNTAFGQVVYSNYVTGAPACVTANTLNCASSAALGHLNPTPGVIYNYKIATTPAAVGSVLWFVTDQSNIIVGTGPAPVLQPTRDPGAGAGNYILSNGANYNVAGAGDNIDISWKNFDGVANKVVLVAYITGAVGCSDNVEVWRIEPKFTFTLDVLSMFDGGTLPSVGNVAEECVSPVESATYDGNNLTMNYGKNYVFFSVNAANFVGSWMPALSAVSTTGTVGTVQWAYPLEAVKNLAGVATGTWNATTVPVNALVGGGVVGTGGECIVVRVEIINAGVEAPAGVAINTVTLSVDGIMHDPIANIYTNATLKDLSEGALVTDPCRNNIPDLADYKILARPDITEVTPAPGTFEPKN